MQKVDSSANYRVNWNKSNLPVFDTDVSSDIISKFKINTSVFNINNHKSNPNAKCVSTLLNSNLWSSYIDSSKGNNQTAIGGPTVQLWMDSWNERYQDDKIFCDSANDNGYYLRKNTGSPTSSMQLNFKKDNGGELYFANNRSALADGKDTVNFYWIASTSKDRNSSVIKMTMRRNVLCKL